MLFPHQSLTAENIFVGKFAKNVTANLEGTSGGCWGQLLNFSTLEWDGAGLQPLLGAGLLCTKLQSSSSAGPANRQLHMFVAALNKKDVYHLGEGQKKTLRSSVGMLLARNQLRKVNFREPVKV